MADKQISGLTAAAAGGDTDLFIVSQGGNSRKMTGAQLKTYAQTGLASYTDEQARDAIGAALVAGTNMTITVNDAGDTITLAAGGGTPWDFVPPLASAFTLFTGDANAAALADDADIGLKLTTTVATASAITRGGYKALPAGDFDLKMKFSIAHEGVASIGGGLTMYESATGKASSLVMLATAADGFQSRRQPIAGGANTTFNITKFMNPNINWVRMQRSGTTLNHYWSYDGKIWINALSVVQTSPFTTAPDRIGPSLFLAHATLVPAIHVQYWNQNW